LRSSDGGVRSPATRNRRAIRKNPNGLTSTNNTSSVAGVKVTSRSSVYVQTSTIEA
jgi:hypothetical protein